MKLQHKYGWSGPLGSGSAHNKLCTTVPSQTSENEWNLPPMITDISHSVLHHPQLIRMTEARWVTGEQPPVIGHFHVDTAIVKTKSGFG